LNLADPRNNGILVHNGLFNKDPLGFELTNDPQHFREEGLLRSPAGDIGEEARGMTGRPAADDVD
jgi:hypothetical protein